MYDRTLFLLVGNPLTELTTFANRVLIPTLVRELDMPEPVVGDFIQTTQRLATKLRIDPKEAKQKHLTNILGMLFGKLRNGANQGKPLVLIRENDVYDRRAKALRSVPTDYRRIAVEMVSRKRGVSTVYDPVLKSEGFDEVWRFSFNPETLEYAWLEGGWEEEPELPEGETVLAEEEVEAVSTSDREAA